MTPMNQLEANLGSQIVILGGQDRGETCEVVSALQRRLVLYAERHLRGRGCDRGMWSLDCFVPENVLSPSAT